MIVERARGAISLSSTDNETASPRSPTRFLPFGLVAAAATGLFLQTRSFGLLGFDSFPLVAESRIRSFADLLATFTESLMAGYYPVDYYRPLLKLTFAADYAVWGLEPFGYQLTNVLVYAGCAIAVWALARRLSGPEAVVAPWLALAVFLLHPVHYDVVPIPARRSEMLCCAFMALSVWLQLSPRALRVRFPLWPAAATLAALASKETAFVLPAVSFVAVLLYAPGARGRDRFVRAVQAVIPHAVVVLAMLGVRASLGFVGTGGLMLTAGGIRRMFGATAAEPLLTSSAAGRWVLSSIAVVLLVGFALSLFGWAWRRRGGDGHPSLRAVRPELVALVWVAAVLLLTYGRSNPWKFEYLYLIPMAGWALLTGAIVGRTLRFARAPGVRPRVAAAVMILTMAVPIVYQARYSPLLFHYGEGEEATAAARSFLGEARALIDQAADGSVVPGPHLPRRVPPRDPLRIFGTMIFLDYSVQAWADLTFPERRIRVIFSPAGRPRELVAAPDEVVLLLARKRRGF